MPGFISALLFVDLELSGANNSNGVRIENQVPEDVMM